ncbi:MAG: 30S ribosomal protein S8 [Candidatus Aenigmatarchaeota archaeon]|nr:30S ribosomal protein S8 [Candidatus Aenigmarchaeota archaeon]
MQHNLLADVLSKIKNAERTGKKEVIIKRSKLVENVLKVMQENKYIGRYEIIPDNKQGLIRVELKNKIVDCNVISPRFSVKIDEIEKYEKRFLPAKGVGILILTTSKGVIDNKKAKELHIGGKLLAYVY